MIIRVEGGENMRNLSNTVKEFGDTQGELAKILGISETTLSLKINGKAEFKQTEIRIIADRYSLTADDIKELFNL